MPDAVSFSSASRSQAVALRYAGTLVDSRASGGDATRGRAGTAHDESGEDTLEQIRARRAIQAQREAQRTRYDAQPAAHKAERRQSAAQGDTTAGGASAAGAGPAAPAPAPATSAAGGDPAPAASGGESAGTGGHTGGPGAAAGGGGAGSGHGGGQGAGGHGGYSIGIGNILRIGLGSSGPSITLRV